MAPVNAPFTWPNSSLSIRFSGIAPQLTVMNGPFARFERRWISRAISSLPVPVSPVISTLMSVAATFCSLRNTSIIDAQAPMISPKRLSLQLGCELLLVGAQRARAASRSAGSARPARRRS